MEGEQSELIPSQIANIDGIKSEANCEKSIGFDGAKEFGWIAALNAPVFIPREAKKEEKIEENREIEKNEETGEYCSSPISEYFPATPTLSEIDMGEWYEAKLKEEKAELKLDDEEMKGRMEDKEGDEMKMEEEESKEKEDDRRERIPTQLTRIEHRSDKVVNEEMEEEFIQSVIRSPLDNIDARRGEEIDETEWYNWERKEMKMQKNDEETKGRKEEKKDKGKRRHLGFLQKLEKERDERAFLHSMGMINGITGEKVEAKQRDLSQTGISPSYRR
ncbi:hypothetical protein PENTCL1PPCAC_14099 [Pristionchus entomophagus]|uniref:Uncharacterized protein n=1 Tax=Pristionchus entomophagus TaxID=358040 RepID=A0AAV5T9D4_9BILA|nr:hypothetical protein PENTCL1PPCAC_14099 [Pristionchus entomophagus]